MLRSVFFFFLYLHMFDMCLYAFQLVCVLYLVFTLCCWLIYFTSRHENNSQGVGYPLDIVVCSALGADMYDCVYPTRTARFGTALVPEVSLLNIFTIHVNIGYYLTSMPKISYTRIFLILCSKIALRFKDQINRVEAGNKVFNFSYRIGAVPWPVRYESGPFQCIDLWYARTYHGFSLLGVA